MSSRSRRLHPWTFALALVAGSLLLAPSSSGVQEKPGASLQEEIARSGVFFRADAPSVLRNREDPYLPVFLEILNGVEKTGLSKVALLARQITREPLELEGVNIYVKPAGAKRRFATDPLRLGESRDFTFDARNEGKPLPISDRMEKTLEIPLDVLRAYLQQHFVGGPFDVIDLRAAFSARGWPSQDFYLRVRLTAPPLPQIPNWYRGDIHYHSGFTDNPAERGYPLGVTKQAALQADLHWLLLSDHSTDLNAERYAEELREAVRFRDGRFLYIAGEEVSAASGKEDSPATLHVLALPSPDDPDRGFPDPARQPTGSVIMSGDGSVTSTALPLEDVFERIARAGGFAYAAHPDDPISPLLRGGTWELDLDFLAPGGRRLRAGLVGLEPWNRATNATADDARDPFCVREDSQPSSCFQPDKEANQYARLENAIKLSWIPLLRKGLETRAEAGDAPAFKVFLAAGSDTHGDFNYEATLDVVDFLSRRLSRLTGYAEDNALGKVATVVYCPRGMGRRGENVLLALREGRSVLSNGPLLIAAFDRNADGSLDDPAFGGIGQQISFPASQLPALQLVGASSEEFGPFTSVRLFVGSREGESTPLEVPLPPGKALGSGDWHYSLDLHDPLRKLDRAWGYIRLEARTRNKDGEEFRCYTNPIWVRLTKR